MMIWELQPAEATPVDRYGLGGFLKRLELAEASDGGKLEGFTFLHDWSEMLAVSRQIEDELLEAGSGGPLYVGFQHAGKLAGETRRYRRLRDRGVVTIGFGEGVPTGDAADVVQTWCPLTPNHARLENQWFLFSMAPSPIAFIGWEVSDERLWGQHGVSTAGKQFTGFVSSDERVVRALIWHLEAVLAEQGPGAGAPRVTTPSLIERLHPRRVVTLIDDGNRPYLTRTLAEVVTGCAGVAAELLLYDLAAASYLTNPYPEGEEKRWRRPIGAPALRSFGRAYAAERVEQGQAVGVETQAVLPYDVGFKHLAAWCNDLGVDLVVLPVEFTRRSLIRRLQRYTLDALWSKSGVPVLIDDPEHGSRLIGSPVSNPPRLVRLSSQ